MSNVGTKPVRSPSYPNTPLAEAVAAVRKIESQYRNAPVDRIDGAKILGYSGLSGPANQALSSLAHYGLVERAGKGHVKVTERARAILHPASENEKREHLRRAAVEPDLFRELQERFPNMTPPEEGVVTYLNRQGFNQSAIRPAARAYLQTLAYLEEAGVSESHGSAPEQAAESGALKGGGPSITYGGAQVGDVIQWESDGVLRLEKPSRVRLITPDGQYVAVDGFETGIPMEQVIVEQRAPEGKPQPPMFPLGLGELAGNDTQPKAGTRRAVFPLDDGDVSLIFPEGISPEGLEELGQYLDIFLKKEIKKTASKPS